MMLWTTECYLNSCFFLYKCKTLLKMNDKNHRKSQSLVWTFWLLVVITELWKSVFFPRQKWNHFIYTVVFLKLKMMDRSIWTEIIYSVCCLYVCVCLCVPCTPPSGAVLTVENGQSRGQRGTALLRSPFFSPPLRNAMCSVRAVSSCFFARV